MYIPVCKSKQIQIQIWCVYGAYINSSPLKLARHTSVESPEPLDEEEEAPEQAVPPSGLPEQA